MAGIDVMMILMIWIFLFIVMGLVLSITATAGFISFTSRVANTVLNVPICRFKAIYMRLLVLIAVAILVSRPADSRLPRRQPLCYKSVATPMNPS
eukprot:7462578-Lingulodinium_polyedra.AAC.1